MHFSTDQQTLNDLAIFGKPGAASVYELFNRAQTTGGANRIADLFRYPLADPEAINNRVQAIRDLGRRFSEFPFRRELFEAIETYLQQTDERTRMVRQGSGLADRLKNAVATDPHHKLLLAGIAATAELLAALPGFLAAIDADAAGTTLQTELAPVRAVAADRSLLLGDDVARDQLFRFKRREDIRIVLQAIYLVDAYLSVARVAHERGFCYPEALPAESGTVKLEGVYHPHVKNAVANTLYIHPQGNIVFLTGANMAGKSTLMKSLGIALYLAHMGFPVPARSLSFAVREGIYTSINLPDNLGKGISHFYAEVLRVKKVARELGAGKQLFIIMDELFRGTNVKDAYEATVALTSAFAARVNCMFVVSTHIMEAGEALRKEVNNIQYVFLPTKMDGNKPVYTYTLEQGITADRHGMVIVRNAGILELLAKTEGGVACALS